MDYRNFHEELHAYEMKARKLRSEEFRRMVSGLFSPFKRK
ncbi:MAG: RSP_7527 family protein [Paracoccaceae bacterium]